jgi:hypothetical protein
MAPTGGKAWRAAARRATAVADGRRRGGGHVGEEDSQ